MSADWKGTIARWFAGLPFLNSLLILHIATSAGAAAYIVKYIVPQHLQQIQSGYERIDSANRAERTILEAAHSQQMERVVTGLEKALDSNTKLIESVLGRQNGHTR